MKIALNAQLINTAHTYRGAGVSTYSQKLLHALGQQNQRHQLTAYVNDPAFDCEGVSLQRTRWPAHQPTARILWEQVALPLALTQSGADLVHGLVNVLPLATPVPSVVTVHDLSFLRMPERFPTAKRLYLTQLCRRSVAKAQRVIAVSRQTADDLVHFFGIAAQKIEVVYNGVAANFVPLAASECEHFRQQIEVPERFLLYVGTLEPRKNLERLLEAFARWRSQTSAHNHDVGLILAGAQGWFYEQIFEQVRALGLEGRVRFPGFIPAAELPYWYNSALAFVYPSLFEGFGLPVLEAMACGTPVICSRAASLLEVADEAALTFAPEDTEGLVACLEQTVVDEALRCDLRQRGLARAQRFSWRRCAQETLTVYETLL